MSEFLVRPGRSGDESVILELLRELAEYEQLLGQFHITLDVIRRDYLGERPLLNCDLLCESADTAGIATWYWMYGSFAAKRALYLEDLYVRPSFRGRGYGKALLTRLAQKAVAAGADRVDWSVLDWNKPAIDFYDGIGARPVRGWLVYRLEGRALKDLGQG